MLSFRSKPLCRFLNFLDERGDAWSLSMFRIFWSVQYMDFGVNAVLSVLREWELPPIPYPSLSLLSIHSPSLALVLAAAVLVLALCIALGWKTRAVQVLLAVLVPLVFFRSVSLYQNHFAFLLPVTLFLAFASTERYASLDALLRRRALPPTDFSSWQKEPVSFFPRHLILLQASMLYASSGLWKLTPIWFDRFTNTPELQTLMRPGVMRDGAQLLLQNDLLWLPVFAASASLLFLSVSLWSARRHPWFSIFGIILHLLLDASLFIMEFSSMMIAILLLAAAPGRRYDRAR